MAWDDVDLLGYDGLGDPAGLGALYGAMIGAGAATAAEIGTRAFWTTQYNNAELVGLGAGLLAGGIMAAFPQTRHAGITAGAVAIITNGLRAAEKKFGSGCLPGQKWDAATAKCVLAGMGQVSARQMQRAQGVSGLGMVQAQQLNGRPSNLSLLGRPSAQGVSMPGRYGHSYVR